MTTIKPTLTFNCPTTWDKMKIGLLSRYCDNCKRDVQDFTRLTKEEILLFLLKNKDNKVCGRIYKSQLDYHHEDILLTIDAYIQKNKKSNLSFYLLAIGTMTLLSCSTNDNQKKKEKIDSLAFIINGQQENFKEDSKHEKPICKIDSLLPDEFDLVGQIMLVDSSMTENSDPQFVNGVRVMAEVMPEFVGGFDSLYDYFKVKLNYPEWEKKEKIEGNVFVTFVVDSNGNIKDPKILKSVPASKNFDREVLRLVKEMPTWKPGQERLNF